MTILEALEGAEGMMSHGLLVKHDYVRPLVEAIRSGVFDDTTTVYEETFMVPAPGFYDLSPGRYLLIRIEE